MRVLVTGAAGFIGSHLAEAFSRDGSVRAVDNLSNGFEDNLAACRERIEFRAGDLLDPAVRAWAVEGVDAVLHHAALGSVTRSLEHPADSHLHGAHLTMLLLESARAAGVKRFVYASSSSVYGGGAGDPQSEDTAPRPLSPYAATKLAGEYYAAAYARGLGLDTVCLRYFNVFGPRQRADSPYSAVIPRFCAAWLEDAPVTVFGDGTQRRDFTYIENVVHANRLALACAQPLGGAVLNIACGTAHSLNDLVAELNALTGKNVQPLHGPARPGDATHSLAELSRAAKVLGYRPVVDFKTGLARTLAWRQTRRAASA